MNTKSKISFDAVTEQVCKENEHVRLWVYGGTNTKLDVENNRRYRELRDRFIQKISQPGSKVIVITLNPLVVVWQISKTAAAGATDTTDTTDMKKDLGDQKTIVGNGDNEIHSPQQDIDFAAQEKKSMSVVSVVSVKENNTNVIHTDKPTYEYLEQVNAYRCNRCKVVYDESTKDTNAAHPCNLRSSGP